jgi:hypothetical protein
VRRPRREPQQLSAAFGIELRLHRKRLDERRLSASVLTDEERDARVELDPLPFA